MSGDDDPLVIAGLIVAILALVWSFVWFASTVRATDRSQRCGTAGGELVEWTVFGWPDGECIHE